MNLEVRRLGYALGASVENVDLAEPMDDETLHRIRALWLEHIVLCFPRQQIDAWQFRTFCASFGTLDDYGDSRFRHPSYENVMLVTSVPTAIGTTVLPGLRFGRAWHSDDAYTLRPAEATMLLASELPGIGGDTMFTNLYAAFDALSPAMRDIVASLRGVHDYTRTGNFSKFTPEEQERDRKLYPPVVHPIVRRHSETGRPALFLEGRVRCFEGMTDEESRPLLDYLLRHAVRDEFVYRHRWSVGDVVMWDNRCALHLAVQDYPSDETRRMLRCTVLGAPTGRYAD